MQSFVKYLEGRGWLFWISIGILLVSLVGILNFLSGYELSFSLFYIVPVALTCWFSGRRVGIATSLLAALVWTGAELASGRTYSQSVTVVLNIFIRFGVFLTISLLLVLLRESRLAEQAAARTDYISGAFNARFFHEILEMELTRDRRYSNPFSVVYMDIDNFKVINDERGHLAGNQLIRCVAEELKQKLRASDIVARIGGDEFVILLPVCGQDESRTVLSRLHADLTAAMQQRNWPVTFSMGAVVCTAVPDSAEEVIKMADELMYTVKNSTKDNIRISFYTGTPSDTGSD